MFFLLFSVFVLIKIFFRNNNEIANAKNWGRKTKICNSERRKKKEKKKSNCFSNQKIIHFCFLTFILIYNFLCHIFLFGFNCFKFFFCFSIKHTFWIQQTLSLIRMLFRWEKKKWNDELKIAGATVAARKTDKKNN